MKGIAIIAAAGKGQRAGVDKVWTKLSGKTVLERAAAPFFASPTIDAVILAVAPARLQEATELFAGSPKPCFIVAGGETRTQSIKNALQKAKLFAGEEDTIVAVHDGARPYLSRELLEECMTVAAAKGSAVPALPCTDTLRRLTEGGSTPLPREQVVRVQTPQCFALNALISAYSHAEEATDDATLYEKYIGEVALVKGEEQNKKITYYSDIFEENGTRIGMGFDVHPLVENRKLILGGVEIPHKKGLLGHSDADALVHAIMDALLTAVNLPDIGHLFPPDDPKYEGANSIELLKEVVQQVKARGYVLSNLSATIMAEAPKMAPHLPQMQARVAEALETDPANVSFAATTTEKLGIVGEEKGIAAGAVVLLKKLSIDETARA